MKYDRVVEWATEGDYVRIDMLGEDGEVHRLEISTGCAGVLVSALAAEAEKRNQAGGEQQLIRPTGMQVATTGEGEPMVLMSLKGGVELPLVFKRESLNLLIGELQRLTRLVQGGSQVRWN